MFNSFCDTGPTGSFSKCKTTVSSLYELADLESGCVRLYISSA